MSDRVTVHVADGVADVRMNRPDKLNAIDGAMFQALADAGESLHGDPAVRAVVLSGEGRSFCAGLDMSAFAAMADSGSRPARDESAVAGSMGNIVDRLPGRITNLGQQAVYAWTELPVPVIAAVRGHAFGGGLQIALGADIRITAPDARFSVMEIKWGIVPDMTGVPMLLKLVGIDVVKELTFTGRQLSGTEAVALGLATRVSDQPLEDALALARDIAARNPDAIRGAKALIDADTERSLADAFRAESQLMADLIGSPNQVEAVTAELERRPAVYRD